MMNQNQFEKQIEIRFKNKSLLLQALTHRSYLNENPAFEVGHNERLEFLGDAVLELAVTQELYERFPEKPEGELTSLRAALVNAEMLAQIAELLDMNKYLLLSRGERKDMGRARHYILANAFEALVGAIYLDQGYKAAEEFIKKMLIVKIDEVVEKKLWKDPKSTFQEEAQERVGVTPSYRVIKEVGPDHQKRFSVGVYVGAELVAEGMGASKQEAEVAAASKALEKKGWR
jgi:ribonuclease-3